MVKRALLLFFLVLNFSGSGLLTVLAEEPQPQEIKVLEGYISANTPHPVHTLQSVPVFENDVGKLIATTTINRADENTRIKHLWFLRDQIIFDTTVQIKNKQNRAQSGLFIKPGWTGKWRVDVTSSDGTLLYSLPFIIHRKPESAQGKPADAGARLESNPFSVISP